MNNDTITTVLGAILAVVLAASNVDYSKLVEGDPREIGKMVSSALVALLGYFTNKKDEAA